MRRRLADAGDSWLGRLAQAARGLDSLVQAERGLDSLVQALTHGQDCPCYLHGLEARATQGRRRNAGATRSAGKRRRHLC
ncbi:MAG: hypothetical protein NZ556_05815 [Fimbriimonadales bacterium]|nr:hypothetical protein [Fimbriimonadales bacterium]